MEPRCNHLGDRAVVGERVLARSDAAAPGRLASSARANSRRRRSAAACSAPKGHVNEAGRRLGPTFD